MRREDTEWKKVWHHPHVGITSNLTPYVFPVSHYEQQQDLGSVTPKWNESLINHISNTSVYLPFHVKITTVKRV